MRKITLDENFKQEIITELTEHINKLGRYTDSEITFKINLKKEITTPTEKPTIYITSKAYLKMLMYILTTNTEIAWHGTVTRKNNSFLISNVYLYPQTITNITVNTDQDTYQTWLAEIEDDNTVNNMRFQGHSHVNMSTSPSGVDTNLYKDILQTLTKEDYYIFTIMNKKLEADWYIYDLKTNTLYENTDINIVVLDDTQHNLLENIAEEKAKYCKTHKYTCESYKNYNKIKLPSTPPAYSLTHEEEDYYNAFRDYPDYEPRTTYNFKNYNEITKYTNKRK